MPAAQILYRDLAYVFVAAACGGLVARWLRQPLIVGYVLAGILIGPFTPGPTISDVHALELLAEIGVILLMYSIGIEFSFRDLLEVKWVALLGAPLGIALSVGLGLAVGRVAGWSSVQSVAVGAAMSVASTMVLSRFLIERNELLSGHGRVMIGITLVEDVAVVMLTVLLPAMNTGAGNPLPALVRSVGLALLLMVPVAFVAARVVPPLLARVAATGSKELFVLVSVALGFATAAITQELGLSLALGAFLAGLVISGSEYAHRTLDELLPIRDVFVALFFVTIGALVNPRVLLSHPVLLATLLLMIIPGKFAIWTAVVRLFRYPMATAVRVGVGLTQIGEFSYVLISVSRHAELVDDAVYHATLTASLVSILINAALMRLVGARKREPALAR
jgi:monovalent cation:H+ antiporter-2, CPA2 family